MEPESTEITDSGVLTLSQEDWDRVRKRTSVIAPLAALQTVGYHAVSEAAQQLGISRRQVYSLIKRAREGSGLLTDLVPRRTSAARVKGDCLKLLKVSSEI